MKRQNRRSFAAVSAGVPISWVLLVVVLSTPARAADAYGCDVPPQLLRTHPVDALSWGFRNYKNDSAGMSCDPLIKDFDWELYRRTFIGIPAKTTSSPFDQLFFELVYRTEVGRVGNCFGMSLLSLMLHDKGGHLGYCGRPLDYRGDLTADCFFTDSDGDSKATANGPDSPGLRRAVGQMHGHQVHLAHVRYFLDVLDRGKSRDGVYAYEQVEKHGLALISITKNLGPGSGHTMLAYDVGEEPGDPNTKYIYFYDPNYPWADDNFKDWYEKGLNRITIDATPVTGGEWSYPRVWSVEKDTSGNPVLDANGLFEYEFDSDPDQVWGGSPQGQPGGGLEGGHLVITPLSVAGPKGRTPSSLGLAATTLLQEILISGDGASLVQARTADGRRLFVPGTRFVDRDPDTGGIPAVPLYVSDGLEVDTDTELGVDVVFVLDDPGGPLDLEIRAGEEGYQLVLGGRGNLLRISAVGARGVDLLRLADVGSAEPRVVLLDVDSTAHYEIEFTQVLELGRRARVFRVSNLLAPRAAPVELRVRENQTVVEVASPVADIGFDLDVREITGDDERRVELTDLVVDAHEAQSFGPDSWSDPELFDIGIAVRQLPGDEIEGYCDGAFGPAAGPLGDHFDADRSLGAAGAGETEFDGVTGVYTQTAQAGVIGVDGDRFPFAYRLLSGDFEFTVEITAAADLAPPEGRTARYGLMARQDCSPGSKYSLLEPDVWSFRPVHGDVSAADDRQAYALPDDEKPMYLKLVRTGTVFCGFTSVDGTAWRPVGVDTWYGLSPNESVLVGFASTAGADLGGANLVTSFRVHALGPIDPPLPGPIVDDGLTAGIVVVEHPFDAADDAVPAGFSVQQRSGSFEPRVADGRLRLVTADEEDSATSAFSEEALEDIDSAIYQFDFDVYFGSVGPRDQVAEGLTFVLAGGRDSTRVGYAADGLGYDGLGRAVESGQNVSSGGFAVELDLRAGAGQNEGSGAPGTPGSYHVGVDVLGSVDSVVQTSAGLPDPFDANGIHVRVLYNRGRVVVALAGNGPGGGELAEILRADVLPVSFGVAVDGANTAVYGFTASTGEDTLTIEVDDLVVRRIECDDVPEVAIVEGLPEEDVPVGELVTLDGSGSHGGDTESREPVSYLWRVLRGGAEIVGPDYGPTVSLRLTESGDVDVQLTVEDGRCTDSTSVVASFVVGASGSSWRRCDCNGDGGLNISDPIALLTWLFASGRPGDCAPACDCNGDGGINISDALFDLNYQFAGGPPPPAPYPDCEPFDGCGSLCAN